MNKSMITNPLEHPRAGAIRHWAVGVVLLGVTAGGLAAAIAYFQVYGAELPVPAATHFRELKQIELCTLNPIPLIQRETDPDSPGPGQSRVGLVHGYEIVELANIDNDGKLIAALYKSDKENNSTAAACFNPRHAIRDPDNHDNYLIICFECLQLTYSFDGEKDTILISESASALFESMVDKHGLKRARDLLPNAEMR